MESMVKQSIDSRKDSFTLAYKIKDNEILKKIDELFVKIYALGEECNNQGEFETKFASSPLNTEYINLFTEVASKCEPIVYENDNRHVKTDEEYLKEEMERDARLALKDATMPARRIARESFDRKMRDTPLGTIEQVSNMKGVFNKFFKK